MQGVVTSREEFLDRVALERQLLETGIPVAAVGITATFDFRVPAHTVINVSLVESISDGAVNEIRAKLMASFFGTAWKILDCAVELALCADAAYATSPKWQPEAKRKWLDAGKGALAALPELTWPALAALYVATIEVRHSLVHRTSKVLANGDLVSEAKHVAQPVPMVTAEQQAAFCRLAQWLADTIGRTETSFRECARGLSLLSVLKPLHGIDLGSVRSGEVVGVIARLPEDGHLDIRALKERLDAKSPGWVGADLELDTDYGLLFGQLESIDEDIVHVDPRQPPAWLRRSLRPS